MDVNNNNNTKTDVSTEIHLPLTRKETREIVTPYAFVVSDDLLGVPLASPMRRAVAMGIDSIIIFGLATASLLFILPVMLYLSWLRFQLKKYIHVALLLLVTVALSGTATFAPQLISEQDNDTSLQADGDNLDATQSALLAVTLLELMKEQCQFDCVASELEKASEQLAQAQVPTKTAKDLLSELLDATDTNENAKRLLLKKLMDQYPKIKTSNAVLTRNDADVAAPAKVAEPLMQQTAEQLSQDPAHLPAKQQAQPWYMPSEDTQSVIGWVKGILADFGIGFGWAVFYFTAYIHWAHGQTIGKKLCQIKVIQLDGSELSAFAAFSRQGGYGAGFATGLMGFLQVFWDPNRQAIQDKVVSTVVIRLNQPKRPLHH